VGEPQIRDRLGEVQPVVGQIFMIDRGGELPGAIVSLS